MRGRARKPPDRATGFDPGYSFTRRRRRPRAACRRTRGPRGRATAAPLPPPLTRPSPRKRTASPPPPTRSVNLVPTQYWFDQSSTKYSANTCHPENWAENQKVDYFCNKWEWDSPCEAFTWDKVARFERGIKDCIQKVRARCFGHALDLGCCARGVLAARAPMRGHQRRRPAVAPLQHRALRHGSSSSQPAAALC